MAGLSHVSVGVNDVARAKAFYDPLMRLLGLKIRQADGESVDYGSEDGLAFSLETPVDRRPASAGNGVQPLKLPIEKRWIASIVRRCASAAETRDHPVCGPSTAPPTTALSY